MDIIASLWFCYIASSLYGHHCLSLVALASSLIWTSPQAAELEERLDGLAKHHSELSVQCSGLRRRIEQARALQAHT